MNQVTITISGPPGSGKTVLAAVIEQTLEKHGFTVRNIDPDQAVIGPPSSGVIRHVAMRSEVSIEPAMEDA